LQLSLPASRATGKDIENQLSPVDDPQVQLALQVAQLGGCEIVVEDDHVCGGAVRGTPNLVEFASPHQGCRVRFRRSLDQRADDVRARSNRQLAEFSNRILGIRPARNPP